MPDPSPCGARDPAECAKHKPIVAPKTQLTEQAILKEIVLLIDTQIDRKTSDPNASLLTSVPKLVFKVSKPPTTSTNMQADQNCS